MTVFLKTVESEERVELMQELIERKLGVAEVEKFFDCLAEKSRNVKNKLRRENLIVQTMKDKYHDTILERNAWRTRKARTIKLVIRRGKSQAKLILRESRKCAVSLRREIKAKYKNALCWFSARSPNAGMPAGKTGTSEF